MNVKPAMCAPAAGWIREREAQPSSDESVHITSSRPRFTQRLGLEEAFGSSLEGSEVNALDTKMEAARQGRGQMKHSRFSENRKVTVATNIARIMTS